MDFRSKEIRVLLIAVFILIIAVSPVGTERARLPGYLLSPGNARIDNSLTDSEMFSTGENGVEWFMNNWDIKGASVAVARDGKLVYARGFGYASLDDSIPVEPYNRFRIASISKLVTAIAIMK